MTTNTGLRDLFLLRPDVIFLNHGSFGACPRPVFDSYQSWQWELERDPVDFLARRSEDLMKRARAALGTYVGADADDLVFVSNATTGANIVARSLPLGPGDEVLATDHEYGALDRTWQFICRKRGARYVRQTIPLPVISAEQVVQAVWAGVTDRTKVLFVSHITSPTAIVLPVRELIGRAREAGIITIVDGAHAPGQVPLDLEALGADFYVGNCHKWMMAPKGAGFLHARRERQGMLEPLIVSWGWEGEAFVEQPQDTSDPSQFVRHHEWQGTRDLSAFLTVLAAIQFMERHAWPRVRRTCHELVRYARRAITELTGLDPITPDTGEWFAQMAAFPLPPCDADTLGKRLYRDHGIEVPITTWNERRFVRVSVQGYNTRADVDALVAALQALLRDAGNSTLEGLD